MQVKHDDFSSLSNIHMYNLDPRKIPNSLGSRLAIMYNLDNKYIYNINYDCNNTKVLFPPY